jgi:hypothetical protein
MDEYKSLQLILCYSLYDTKAHRGYTVKEINTVQCYFWFQQFFSCSYVRA